jgi:signal transduction histidine kinase
MTVPALRNSRLFEGLDDDALGQLARKGKEVEVAVGADLLSEGSEPDAMFVLLDGELEVHKQVDGDEVPIGTVRQGELVGELGLLHGRPRSAGVRATRPSRLLRIPADALDDLLGHPPTSRELLATATRRLEQQEVLLRQHGRMAALGNLTAGLLHELNNPAAAVGRAVDHLADAVEAVRRADRRLVEAVPPDVADRLIALGRRPRHPPADPLARSDAEDAWRAWLEAHGVEQAWTLAGELAAAGLAPQNVEASVHGLPPAAVEAGVRSVAAALSLGRLLREARTGAEHISEIVGAVKTFSHHGEAPVQQVDVHAGIEAALTLLAHKVPAGVDIRRVYADDLPAVEGYPGDLNVVWTNLVDNALDAVGDAGVVAIATRAEDGRVVVEVTDDGPGIPAEVADRVFDPFFTTKPVGQGTGVGLATTHVIVTQGHRGRIWIDSSPGRTTVSVALPVRHGRSERHGDDDPGQADVMGPPVVD